VNGQQADYDGTYTVYAVALSLNGSGARTVQAGIRQYEYPGGPNTLVQTPAVEVDPADPALGNLLIRLGEIQLPGLEVPPDNSLSYFAGTITSDNASDRFLDLVLLDTQGDTIIIDLPASAAYPTIWVDEPVRPLDIGLVLGSAFDRASAVSLLASVPIYSGGPLRVQPGDVPLLLYSPQGVPCADMDYYPRWRADRLV
jgi:hypothetical protein